MDTPLALYIAGGLLLSLLTVPLTFGWVPRITSTDST